MTQQNKTGSDFHATQKHNLQACCSSVLDDRRRLVQRRKKSLNGDGGGDIRVLHRAGSEWKEYHMWLRKSYLVKTFIEIDLLIQR